MKPGMKVEIRNPRAEKNCQSGSRGIKKMVSIRRRDVWEPCGIRMCQMVLKDGKERASALKRQ